MRDVKIMVVGVGGAGSRIVERLADTLGGAVAVAAVNTDAAALAESKVGTKVQIGASRTGGFGAGGDVNLGRLAAEDDKELLRSLFSGRDLVLLVLGLGGGTGTGAAQVVLGTARDAGAMTMCFVTLPFDFEGAQRKMVAEGAISGLREVCDALIAVPNDRLMETVGEGTLSETFARTDQIVSAGIRGICKLITHPGYINLDFADLQRVIRNSGGICTFGYGDGAGQNRAEAALAALLNSPLLEKGARVASAAALLVSVVGGSDLTVREIKGIMAAITAKASKDCHVAMGTVVDEDWQDRITITVVASDEWVVPEPAPPPAAEAEDVRDVPVAAGRAKRKTAAAPTQGDLELDPTGKGRFKGTEPTMMDGENLDIPTYLRRGIAIEK